MLLCLHRPCDARDASSFPRGLCRGLRQRHAHTLGVAVQDSPAMRISLSTARSRFGMPRHACVVDLLPHCSCCCAWSLAHVFVSARDGVSQARGLTLGSRAGPFFLVLWGGIRPRIGVPFPSQKIWGGPDLETSRGPIFGFCAAEFAPSSGCHSEPQIRVHFPTPDLCSEFGPAFGAIFKPQMRGRFLTADSVLL